MPDDKTIAGLAQAFEGVSEQTVRDAAARALGAVGEAERQAELDLQRVSIDALLTEIKRRVQANEDTGTQDTQGDPQIDGEAGTRGTPNTRAAHGGADKVTPLRRRNQGSQPDPAMPGAASERVKEKTDTPDFEPGS
ncbi:hypothetical protein CH259_16755 [Rhodococcus sp. 05-2254-4]|nr:hypothetical protein CH259_16755 [Rhodococcus sp. 05-2254-4]OZE48102.1 hypothetical protein CH261_09350 [Rhodococcus sp. 05-2254-3]OZE49313.1 hypothetical protein CH283_17135 [Rhodococcus sp. 05-2254-2]